MCAKLSLLIAVVAVAPACSSSNWNVADSDPSTLAGTWRETPYNSQASTPLDELAVATFGSGGAFTYNDGEGDPTQSETYTADHSWLSLTSTDPTDGVFVERQTYVATSVNLMIGAMYPSSEVEDVIGTWHGEQRVTGGDGTGTLTADFDIGADHSFSERLGGLGSDETHTGTWQLDGTDLVVTYDDSMGGYTETYQQFPGVAALGGELFQRP